MIRANNIKVNLVKTSIFIPATLSLMAHSPIKESISANKALGNDTHKEQTSIPFGANTEVNNIVLLAQMVDRDSHWRVDHKREEWVQEQLKKRRKAYKAHRAKLFPGFRSGKRINAKRADKLMKSVHEMTKDMDQEELSEFMHAFFLTAYVNAGHSPTERRVKVDWYRDPWEYYNDLTFADRHAQFATQNYLAGGNFSAAIKKYPKKTAQTSAVDFIAEYGVYVDGKSVEDIMGTLPAIKSKLKKETAKTRAKEKAKYERRNKEQEERERAFYSKKCAEIKKNLGDSEQWDQFYSKLCDINTTKSGSKKQLKAAKNMLKGQVSTKITTNNIPDMNKAFTGDSTKAKKAMDIISITGFERFRVKHYSSMPTEISADIKVQIQNKKGKDIKRVDYSIIISPKSDPDKMVEMKATAPSWKERGPFSGSNINSVGYSLKTSVNWGKNIPENQSDYNFTPFVKKITYTDGSQERFTKFADVVAVLKKK